MFYLTGRNFKVNGGNFKVQNLAGFIETGYNISMITKDQLTENVYAKFAELQQDAERIFGITVVCEIRFNLKGLVGGYAGKKDGIYYIRINTEMGMSNDGFVDEVVTHEFAHIVTMIKYPYASGHGSEWKLVMLKLGARPNRCHNFRATPARKTKKFDYSCPACKRSYELGAKRHNKSMTYFKACGRTLYLCPRCRTNLQPVEKF